MATNKMAEGDPGHAAVETYCFRTEAFTEPSFSVEAFVKECRLRVPMSDLKSDLDKYYDSLQNSMFTLINKDYGEFLSLSSNLAGLDKSIKDITSPLGELRAQIQQLKGAIDEEITELQQCITRRSQIRDKKALCQRYLNITASVEKIEKLLAGAADDVKGETTEEALSKGSGKLIERVASEFNQLQFYATQCERSPFLDALGPRISAITAMLQKGLELGFRRGLEHSDSDVLRQCIRTYSIIDKITVAEALFRDLVMLPFVTENITKQAVTESGLDGVYDKLLTFIDEKCSPLTVLTTQLNISSCDFLVNSVWPVAAEALSKLGFIFASGIADDFHRNYSWTLSFLNKFEILCGSRRSVERLRGHPHYVAFCRRWSLPVYFQLRFQEIAGATEGLFTGPLTHCSVHSRPWHLTVGNAVIGLIERCWERDVYLPGLTHRFWKLTLQILARYATFVIQYCTEADSSDLLTCLLLLHDTKILQGRVPSFIHFVLGVNNAISDSSLNEALGEAVKKLDESIFKVRELFCSRLVSKCNDILQNCGNISRQYRHTGRKVPTEPSDFIRKVFDPLSQFAVEAAEHVDDFKRQWEAPIVASVTQKYRDLISQLLVSSKEMEEKLQRVKKLRKGNKVTGMADDDKIRLQLWLDVKEYRKQAANFTILDDVNIVLDELQGLVDEAKPKESSTEPTVSTE